MTQITRIKSDRTEAGLAELAFNDGSFSPRICADDADKTFYGICVIRVICG
jgi:hypothetical protein